MVGKIEHKDSMTFFGKKYESPSVVFGPWLKSRG